jgi:hypothetical protein
MAEIRLPAGPKTHHELVMNLKNFREASQQSMNYRLGSTQWTYGRNGTIDVIIVFITWPFLSHFSSSFEWATSLLNQFCMNSPEIWTVDSHIHCLSACGINSCNIVLFQFHIFGQFLRLNSFTNFNIPQSDLKPCLHLLLNVIWVLKVLGQAKPEHHYLSRCIRFMSLHQTTESSLSKVTNHLQSHIQVKRFMKSE